MEMLSVSPLSTQEYHILLLSIPTQDIRDYGNEFFRTTLYDHNETSILFKGSNGARIDCPVSAIRSEHFSKHYIGTRKYSSDYGTTVEQCYSKRKDSSASCSGSSVDWTATDEVKKTGRRLSYDLRKREADEKASIRREQISCLEQDLAKAAGLLTKMKTRMRSQSVAYPMEFQKTNDQQHNMEISRSLSLPAGIGSASILKKGNCHNSSL